MSETQTIGAATLRRLIVAASEAASMLASVEQFRPVANRLSKDIASITEACTPKDVPDFDRWLEETFTTGDTNMRVDAMPNPLVLTEWQAKRLAAHIWDCFELFPADRLLEEQRQEIAAVLGIMDATADEWSDGAAARRCRDRLRKLIGEGGK